MHFWSTVEKFLNLKIPKKFSKMPFLTNALYFRLFSFLVFKFNPNKQKKHYFLLALLYLISFSLPFFVVVLALILSPNIDFLRAPYLKTFNNYLITLAFEIITYLIFYIPYTYFCGFLQKVFHFYLAKKVKQKLGRLNPHNKFDFLADLDYNKYYNFAVGRVTYFRSGVSKTDKNDPNKIIKNILATFESRVNIFIPGRIFSRYYAQIVLQVFLFNSQHQTLKIDEKYWKVFLFIHFIYFVIDYGLLLFIFWLGVEFFRATIIVDLEFKRFLLISSFPHIVQLAFLAIVYFIKPLGYDAIFKSMS
ncbi:hypothetical protein [Mesomycoplasma ovipneumoniae]|uniref:hypothetical protein n=1 Tax=Mesomycoplasma ovipneumoniae TaxID=29562 RepID=UPI00311ACFE9